IGKALGKKTIIEQNSIVFFIATISMPNKLLAILSKRGFMKHYLVNGTGIDSIQLSEKPSPTNLSDYEVLVDAKAWSLNYRDLMVAKGQYQYKNQNTAPFIPVSDMAGVVRAVGKNVTELKPGDKVLNAPFRHYPAGNLRASWIRTFIG